MYTWKGIFFGMLVPDMVFQPGVGDKCLLTLSTGKNLISMCWKVIIKLSPSFKTLATLVAEEVRSHHMKLENIS